MHLVKRIFFILTRDTSAKIKIILWTNTYIIRKYIVSYAAFECLRFPMSRRRCCSHSLTLKPSSYASAAEKNAAIMCRRRRRDDRVREKERGPFYLSRTRIFQRAILFAFFVNHAFRRSKHLKRHGESISKRLGYSDLWKISSQYRSNNYMLIINRFVQKSDYSITEIRCDLYVSGILIVRLTCVI